MHLTNMKTAREKKTILLRLKRGNTSYFTTMSSEDSE